MNGERWIQRYKYLLTVKATTERLATAQEVEQMKIKPTNPPIGAFSCKFRLVPFGSKTTEYIRIFLFVLQYFQKRSRVGRKLIIISFELLWLLQKK